MTKKIKKLGGLYVLDKNNNMHLLDPSAKYSSAHSMGVSLEYSRGKGVLAMKFKELINRLGTIRVPTEIENKFIEINKNDNLFDLSYQLLKETEFDEYIDRKYNIINIIFKLVLEIIVEDIDRAEDNFISFLNVLNSNNEEQLIAIYGYSLNNIINNLSTKIDSSNLIEDINFLQFKNPKLKNPYIKNLRKIPYDKAINFFYRYAFLRPERYSSYLISKQMKNISTFMWFDGNYDVYKEKLFHWNSSYKAGIKLPLSYYKKLTREQFNDYISFVVKRDTNITTDLLLYNEINYKKNDKDFKELFTLEGVIPQVEEMQVFLSELSNIDGIVDEVVSLFRKYFKKRGLRDPSIMIDHLHLLDRDHFRDDPKLLSAFLEKEAENIGSMYDNKYSIEYILLYYSFLKDSDVKRSNETVLFPNDSNLMNLVDLNDRIGPFMVMANALFRLTKEERAKISKKLMEEVIIKGVDSFIGSADSYSIRNRMARILSSLIHQDYFNHESDKVYQHTPNKDIEMLITKFSESDLRSSFFAKIFNLPTDYSGWTPPNIDKDMFFGRNYASFMDIIKDVDYSDQLDSVVLLLALT